MTIRGLLFSELERLVGNSRRMLLLPGSEHLDWRPRDNMRSLAELANHLAQIPAVDLLILKGAPENDIAALEAELTRNEPAEWAAVMQEGLDGLLRHMEKLSVDNFEHDSATAYYGRTQTHAQWMFEILGHVYHHRAQFFNYLKQLGYPVNTRTLYG